MGNKSYIAITMTGMSCSATLMFIMLNYLPVDQLKWFNIFNVVEGRQDFLKSKIFIPKSAKRFVRISLIILINNLMIIYCLCLVAFVVYAFSQFY